MKQREVLNTSKIIKSLLIVMLLSIASLAEDNKENIQVLNNLYEKVIIKDVKKTLDNLQELKNAVTKKDINEVKKDFTKLVSSWKSVETFYILGDLNEDYIDTPRYIDIFHNGNEDITKQLDRALKSGDAPKIALFKNSLKSINALEYILFTKDIKNSKVNEFAITIINRLLVHVNDINKAYSSNKEKFVEDYKKGNSIVINTIVQSTYKLKEWRVGDIAGLTKKYKNKPNNKRSEYYLSKNSVNAIIAILTTYKNIFENSSFEDYGDYLLKVADETQIKTLREKINHALKLAKEIKNDNLANANNLYDAINEIHLVLFLEIIEDLSISAKILDADGD